MKFWQLSTKNRFVSVSVVVLYFVITLYYCHRVILKVVWVLPSTVVLCTITVPQVRYKRKKEERGFKKEALDVLYLERKGCKKNN